MPRGSKVCPGCGKSVGPRSHFCRHCGHAFTIKGETARPIMKSADDTNGYMDHFHEVKCDSRTNKYYGNDKQCWESNCGKYRIFKYSKFMGVDPGTRRTVVLMKRPKVKYPCGPEWEIVSRHIALKSAARRYVRIKRKMPIRETKAEAHSRQLHERINSLKSKKGGR